MSRSENYRRVSQISRMLRSIIESETLEHYFWAGGRIDRLYKSDLGHVYFELVDGESRIKCVLREERAGHVLFDLRNHLDIEVYGDVRFFERRAEAQINVLEVRQTDESADAVGAIDQLRAEGLYPPVKKSPPADIRRIGVITGRSSRAIGDFETTYQEAGTRAVLPPLSWRYALLEGERAAQSIADAIQALDADNDVDAIAIIRGGGRNENLAAYNDLAVLRAMTGCDTYLVTGIGHHRDHVLADDVADFVVATPTAAAVHLAELCEKNRDREAGHDAPAIGRPGKYDRILLVLVAAAVGALALLAYAALINLQ